MKASSRFLVGLILSLLALATIAPQATADINQRRGMAMSLHNDEGLSFQRPGTYHVTLRIVVWPLWYYVEGLDTYDTVTMTLTLERHTVMSSGSRPILSGNNCASLGGGTHDSLQCTWTNVHLSQDEDGVTLDATLYLGMDVVVDEYAGIALYTLRVNGIATAPGVVFQGHTFAILAVYP